MCARVRVCVCAHACVRACISLQTKQPQCLSVISVMSVNGMSGMCVMTVMTVMSVCVYHSRPGNLNLSPYEHDFCLVLVSGYSFDRCVAYVCGCVRVCHPRLRYLNLSHCERHHFGIM